MRHCGRQARTLFLASHCGSTGGIGRYNPLIHEVRESMCTTPESAKNCHHGRVEGPAVSSLITQFLKLLIESQTCVLPNGRFFSYALWSSPVALCGVNIR